MAYRSQTGSRPPSHGTLASARLLLLLAVCVLATSALHAQSKAQSDSLPASTPQAAPEAPVMPTVDGTTLDQVVAIVNGDLVLDSDVTEEEHFQAFQPFSNPTEDASRNRAIQRLINRDLILQQSRLQPGDDITDAQVEAELMTLRKTIPACKRYACETKAGWDKFLADNDFTEATLVDRWRQRMIVLRFIEERFRMGMKIEPAEIKTYYDKQLLPEYAKQHATPPKLETISDRIQEVLLQQRVSALLSDWLKSLRAQGSVVVMHPGESAP